MTSGYVPEKRKNAPGKISQFTSGTNISSRSPIVITVVAFMWSTKKQFAQLGDTGWFNLETLHQRIFSCFHYEKCIKRPRPIERALNVPYWSRINPSGNAMQLYVTLPRVPTAENKTSLSAGIHGSKLSLEYFSKSRTKTKNFKPQTDGLIPGQGQSFSCPCVPDFLDN